MDEVKPPGQRGTLTFTHKQAGITAVGFIISLFLSNMDKLNSLFTTKSEGVATSTAVVTLKNDTTTAISELRDSTDKRFDKVETLIESRSTEIKNMVHDYNEETIVRFRRKTDLDTKKFEEIDARREKGDDRLESQIRDLQSYIYKKPAPRGG